MSGGWFHCVLLTYDDNERPSVWQSYSFSDRDEAARMVDLHNLRMLQGRHKPDPRTIAILTGDDNSRPGSFVLEASA